MPADPVAKWEEFLLPRYWNEVLEMADTYLDERSLEIRFPDNDKFDPDFVEEQMSNKFEDQNLTCMNQARDWGGPFKLLLAQYARRRNLKEC